MVSEKQWRVRRERVGLASSYIERKIECERETEIEGGIARKRERQR